MTRTTSTLAALLALAFAVGCGDDDDSTCDGDVEVSCDEDGCWCESGPNEGEECVEDEDAEDDCEVVCCDESGLGWF
jgi:hypothetical protein